MQKALIFNIQKFSVHDGPGIRTTVFFSGCSLRCAWCHNPEGFEARPRLLHNGEKCVNCLRCVSVCECGATVESNGRRIFFPEKCDTCGKCATACTQNALEIAGKYYSVDELMREIEKDTPFYEESNGGVTFSGGEAMLYPDFLAQILLRCRARGIHTAIDTAGNVTWSNFEKVLPYADLFLYDIKHLDAAHHIELCGDTNVRILDNLRRLSDSGARIFLRLPLVSGLNDDDDEIFALGEFISDLNIEQINLLPYHDTGKFKYERLGISGYDDSLSPPSAEQLSHIQKILHEYKTVIGG